MATTTSSNQSALKIHISSTDKLGTHLLYEHIVHEAKNKGIAGVTVFRGIMGYGASSSHISTSRYWELTEKLPVLIEIIDDTAILEDFCKYLEPILEKTKKGVLVTMEPVRVIINRAGEKMVNSR
jgi:PII-like signaling protein